MNFSKYLQTYTGYSGSIFEVGSSNGEGSRCADDASLRSQLKRVVSHNFFDWNAYHNKMDAEQKQSFLTSIDEFVAALECNDKLFNVFWIKLTKSGRYDCLFNLRADYTFVQSTQQLLPMKKATKYICWAYPSSTFAKKANMIDTGCFAVVCHVNDGDGKVKPPKFLKGFATAVVAKKYFDTLPFPADFFCLTKHKTLVFTEADAGWFETEDGTYGISGKDQPYLKPEERTGKCEVYLLTDRLGDDEKSTELIATCDTFEEAVTIATYHNNTNH